MISALKRRAKETASLNALRWDNKTNKGLAAVWCHATKYVSRLNLCEYYIPSVVVCGACVTGPDTFNTSEDYLGVWKEEPALQCQRQIYTPDTLSLKLGSGATEGVLD